MRAARLVGVPLVAVSWLAGHELAYRLAAPQAETAHGHLQQAPFFVALLLAAALGGLWLGLVPLVVLLGNVWPADRAVALFRSGAGALMAQHPLVVLMVVYTVGGLWLLSAG